MSAHDFDFFHGVWTVHNRRSVAGQWQEFPADCVVRPLVGGIGFIDEMTFPTLGSGGSTIGLYEPELGRWAHYWVSTRDGVLQPPVYGSAGVMLGDDVAADGKPMRVRYLWQVDSPDSFRWEQAMSTDGEITWATDWTMVFTRV